MILKIRVRELRCGHLICFDLKKVYMGLGANHFSDPFTAFFCSWLFIVLALIIWLFDIELELPLIFFLLLQFVVAGANIRCDTFAAFL